MGRGGESIVELFSGGVWPKTNKNHGLVGKA